MRVLERLPIMSSEELARLERNAQAALAASRTPEDATRVLEALREERSRRAEAIRRDTAAERERIYQAVRHLSLQARVELAFRECPPSSWELRAICALASAEGTTTEQLSSILGYSGGYMNMAFGTLCHDRQAWLGPPPAAKREGQVVYSAILVDFVEKADAESGRRWTEWRLKPEVRAGLQVLKLLEPAVGAS
jgi:hypothetical protein